MANQQACQACVADLSSAACMSATPAIQQGARDLASCMSSSCATECAPKGVLPTVRTVSAGVMAPNLITMTGEVVGEGDSFVRDRGICFSETPSPTAPCAPASTSGTGSFSLIVLGPTAGAVFYVRAYAENGSGRVYGADLVVRTVYLGDTFEGGIVFHTDPAGVHGLIAAPTDQSSLIRWWDTNTRPTALMTGAVATAVGTGNANTNAIVTAQGTGSYAAKLCADLTLNMRSDWYLPSKDELNLMYVNRAAIGNLATAGYWSSSEVGTTVWIQNLATGFQETVPSSNANAVRAIRSF